MSEKQSSKQTEIKGWYLGQGFEKGQLLFWGLFIWVTGVSGRTSGVIPLKLGWMEVDITPSYVLLQQYINKYWEESLAGMPSLPHHCKIPNNFHCLVGRCNLVHQHYMLFLKQKKTNNPELPLCQAITFTLRFSNMYSSKQRFLLSARSF